MKVRWSRTALIELEDIFLYIFERNRASARNVVHRVEQLCARLTHFPYSGPQADEAGVYSLFVVRYPFVIFYTVDEAAGEVVILHVRHTARQRLSE